MREEGSPLFLWKMEMTINKPLKEVAYHYPRLFHNQGSNSAITSAIWYHLNDTTTPENDSDYLIYMVAALPSPLQTRDVTMHATFHQLDENTILLIERHSTIIPVVKKYIRTITHLCGMIFKAVTPTSTLVTSINHTDVKGKIPKWFMNRVGAEIFKDMLKIKEMFESGKKFDIFPVNYKSIKEAVK